MRIRQRDPWVKTVAHRDAAQAEFLPSQDEVTNLIGGPNAMSCTVKDVAKTAGVSIATVSRVLNSARNVSIETRKKVLAAISTLKYCPNAHAAELGRAKGRNLRQDILVPSLDGPKQQLISPEDMNKRHRSRQAKQLRLLENEYSRVQAIVLALNLHLRRIRKLSE